MRFRPVALFVAGAVFSTGVIGTTTWLRASSDTVITACANKKTGVMRYLTKGSCNRKTESLLTWNQSGIAGVAGPKGDTGPAGPQGAEGPTKSSGVFVYDSKGNKLGHLIDIEGLEFESYRIANGSHYFELRANGWATQNIWFSEANCTGTAWTDALPLEWSQEPQNRLLLSPSISSGTPRFWVWSSGYTEPNPGARSYLTDGSSLDEDRTYDGKGTCFPVVYSPSGPRVRTIREVPAPFAVDTSGPLTVRVG